MKNETKQTAVDSLEKAFYKYAESTGINNNKWLIDEEDLDKLINQAKEMEKERMIQFAKQCLDKALDLDVRTAYLQVEKYYNETYGGNK